MSKMLLILISTIALSCDQQNKAMVEFAKKEINLGVMGLYSKREFYISFKNNGQNELKILKVQTSCKCITNTITSDEVQANEEDSVLITYTANELGNFEEDITFITNTDQKFDLITVKSIVK